MPPIPRRLTRSRFATGGRSLFIAVVGALLIAACFDYASRTLAPSASNPRAAVGGDAVARIQPVEIVESSDSDTVLVRTLLYRLLRVSWSAGRAVPVDPFPEHIAFRIAASRDGSTIAVGRLDGSVAVIVGEGGTRRDLAVALPGTITTVACNRDGSHVAAGDSHGNLSVWKTGEITGPRFQVKLCCTILAVRFIPDDRALVVYENVGRVRLYQLDSGRQQFEFQARPAQAVAMAVSTDRDRLLIADERGNAHGWSLRTGTLAWSVSHGEPHVPVLALSPDGRIAALQTRDRTIELRCVGTGRVVDTIVWPRNARAIRFSRDGASLLIVEMEQQAVCRFDLRHKRLTSRVVLRRP